MKAKGGRANYTSVCLPKEFIKKIDNAIKLHPEYRSRADFIKSAVEGHLRVMQYPTPALDKLEKEYQEVKKYREGKEYQEVQDTNKRLERLEKMFLAFLEKDIKKK